MGTTSLQGWPMQACRTFCHAQLQSTDGRLNNKSILDPTQNGTSWSSDKLPSVEVENDECVNLEQNMEVDAARKEDTSIIQPCNEDISTVAPYFRPSFNFAAYVNNSPTLQELVKLGVNLHILEKKKGVPEFILQMEFNKDMKEHIRFLHDLGVPSDELGRFITINPWIFKEDLDDLQVRVNYLQSKKFSADMITRIVQKNPRWLVFSTGEIDQRLGHFQKTFKLTGNEVRRLTLRRPKLITYDMTHIKLNTFSLKEEMGFNDDELKSLLLRAPKLWTKSNKPLLSVFDYAHNVMKLTHQQIVDFPQILRSRTFRLKQRHLFLELLGRAQYNPNLEGYISPKTIVSGTDSEFCQTVAKSSVEAFNIFLKSI